MRVHLEISQERFETISQYLEKQMTPAEAAAFEEQMKKDETLRQEVEEIRLLLLGVEEASVRKAMEKFHSGLPVVRTMEDKKKNGTIRRWLAAASVILLAGLSVWIYRSITDTSRGVFAEYYRQDPGLLTAMSSSDNFDFERAMVDYKTGNYAAAAAVWKRQAADRPDNDTLNYFLGTVSLAMNDPAGAAGYLRKVADQQQSVFAPDANWYLGLALLKLDSIPEAAAYIERSDHPRKEALLQRLKE